MRMDPSRPPEDWHAYLREQAERSWGRERAAAIDGALSRMAAAIARVAARAPRPDSTPGPAPAAGAGRTDAERA